MSEIFKIYNLFLDSGLINKTLKVIIISSLIRFKLFNKQLSKFRKVKIFI